MCGMAKPHMVKVLKRMKLKSGKEKVYTTYALRITVYNPQIKAVAPVYMGSVGSKPILPESRALEIVEEFGKRFGFTLDDLRAIRKLEVVPDEDLEPAGGERSSR